ncbi:hypothetical protein Tco_1058053 [Tanacetum coccineum]|uniref:Uncharacterized protein n=1 Tax=Tanacetum coccineum TaxID=301880 RepID=A0ABQ5H824_9ASTR
MAFVSSENTSSTNEAVNTAHEVSTANSQRRASFSSYANDVMFSFFVSGHAYHESEEILKKDRKESELQWQRNYGISGYDWSFQAEEGPTDFALMAYLSSGSSSSSNLDSELEEALKEKDDLKLKLEKFEESSKNLTKLINSQIGAKDKNGLGFYSHVNESEVLDNVVDSVFDSHKSDGDNDQVNDRFKKSEGYHAVPPPYTGNFKPARADLSFAGLDDSVYKFKVSETVTSKDSLEKSKTVRPSAPIIEEWESDSEDENVFKPKEVKKTLKPSFEKIKFVNARNSTVEKPRKFSQILTKSGQVPVNAAKQRTTISISTARPVNTATPKPKVDDALPTTYSYFKAHSPTRRSFNQKSAAKTNKRVNTVRVNNVTTAGPKAVVSTAEGNKENVVKSSACWIWRPTGNGNPQYALQDQGIFDSGCSRRMTGNKFYLSDYQDIDGGFVAFGGSAKGGKITGKDKIRTGKLDLEDV